MSARLGVSPVPLYSRIGNKDALARRDRRPAPRRPRAARPRRARRGSEYAVRWARCLRDGVRRARDSRLVVWPGREAYVEASRPLVDVLRRDGFAPDAAVQACRLLTWATVGFGAVESGVEPPGRRRRRRSRPGSDPARGRPGRGRHAVRPPHPLRGQGIAGRRGPMTIPTLDATGKVVVVTGGSKGLGRAMALGFAEAGRRRGGGQPQARCVRGGGRRGAGARRPGHARWPATSATGTSARRSSSGPSRSSAASTCS